MTPPGRRVARRLLTVAICPLAMATWPAGAHACAVDGVPSLRADGARVVLNSQVRTRQNGATWAPFVCAHPLTVGRPVHLSEDMAELARSLPPEIVHGHWIWRLGDGAGAQGYSARHAYAKAGTYLVTVGVRIPGRRIFTFDAAQIRVIAPA